ncbi:hypothetical protein C8J57DRAFT_1471500 [Mycena rebaudengoi]|nr:hypothetical protein C8J57DRAFT_1471500 [Mycena rebaudengoi]
MIHHCTYLAWLPTTPACCKLRSPHSVSSSNHPRHIYAAFHAGRVSRRGRVPIPLGLLIHPAVDTTMLSSFTKDDIIRAAGLTPSATNGNNKLFQIAIRLGSSELRRWAQQDQDDREQLEEDERKRLQELYGDLPYKEFSEEMKAMEKTEKEKKEKAKQKKKAKATTNAGPSKGHKRHQDGDDEAESERKQKKKKGKGKAKEVLSDELEEAESSLASDSD